MDQAAAEPSLPFFIEWEPETKLPGHATVHKAGNGENHPGLPSTQTRCGWPDWLGKHHLPIVVRAGTPAVTAIYTSQAMQARSSWAQRLTDEIAAGYQAYKAP